MGVYRRFEELLQLKTDMDKANIPDLDRAVVLDWDDWRDWIHINCFIPKDATAPSTILGFRIIWRHIEIVKKETFKL